MICSNHMNQSRFFGSQFRISIYENNCNGIFFFLKNFRRFQISTRNNQKFLHGGGHLGFLQRGFNRLNLIPSTVGSYASHLIRSSTSSSPAVAHSLTPPFFSFPTYNLYFSFCRCLLLGDVMVKLSHLCEKAFSLQEYEGVEAPGCALELSHLRGQVQASSITM